MPITFSNDDILHWANTYQGPKFHAFLCDPPYHLTQPNIRNAYNPTPGLSSWDAIDEARKQARAGKNAGGFMGKEWDGGDIAFQPDTWAALAEHLLPGAFLMAFGGSRTYHRMACAIEDAGFIIHPAISWVYGSGFPKATRIDTQIDRAAGAERDISGMAKGVGKQNPEWNGTARGRKENSLKPEYELTKPATPLARAWEGHRYGLQALKPAAEFICVAQKPYEGRPVDSIVETGAGALNVDGGRIPGSWERKTPWKNDIRGGNYCTSSGRPVIEVDPQESNPNGRWPANLVLDSVAAERMDEQSGTLKSGGGIKNPIGREGLGWACSSNWRDSGYQESSSGGASRFFFTYPAEALDEADPMFYCAKSSRRERDAGLDGMEAKSHAEREGRNHTKNSNWVIDPRSPDGGYPKKETGPVHNPHPTVKPLALNKYLATLLLPPAEYAPRRILIPFGGVGSEAIGAMQAGWDEIVAVEREAEYVQIGQARAEYWAKKCAQLALELDV